MEHAGTLIAKSGLKATHAKKAAEVVAIAWTGGGPRGTIDSSGSSSEQTVTSFDFIVRDYDDVAMLMGEKRVLELVALAEALSTNPLSKDASSLLADEATDHQIACATRQIQALRWLADQLEENEDGTWPMENDRQHRRGGVARLLDSWVMAGAARVNLDVRCRLNQPDMSKEQVTSAWGLVEGTLHRWKSTLREGATEPLLETIPAWCNRECQHLVDI